MPRLSYALTTIYGRGCHLCTPKICSTFPARVGLLCNGTPVSTIKLFSTQPPNYTVKHDIHANSFYIDIKEKGRAFLEYSQGEDEITILHTEIPEQLQGLGLGKIIAKEALKYVAKNNLKLNIECEFVQHYVEKYEPKYLQHMR